MEKTLLCSVTRWPYIKTFMRTMSNKPSKPPGKSKYKSSDSSTKKAPSLDHLQKLFSQMKVNNECKFSKSIKNYNNSDMFVYATDKRFSQTQLVTSDLKIWQKLRQTDLDNTIRSMPLNGFEEMIALTEQGKLWRYPIDNEQDMEEEQKVPFEDHIMLDSHLDGFPKNEQIQNFMSLVVAGLAKNHWMTVERKKEVIKFYKDYFESKRDVFKDAGLEI